MIVKLFDVENGDLVPTEHCYALPVLKKIMDLYKNDYIEIYKYLFYMTCPNPDINPFFHLPSNEKEDVILSQINKDVNIDTIEVKEAKLMLDKLYDTPISRSYKGIKAALDKLAAYMENTEIVHGRDGNINSIIAAAKNFDQVRQSFKGAYKDLVDEQTRYKGSVNIAYDQR